MRHTTTREFLFIAAVVTSLAVACAEEPARGGDLAGEEPGIAHGGKADVTVGPVVSMACQSADRFVRRGGVVEVVVDARDAAGKASRNYSVEVFPAIDTRVVQRNKVIFGTDGSYDIRCCALDTDICDVTSVQVGQPEPAVSVQVPLFVDKPGQIELRGRAAASDGDDVYVEVDGRSAWVGSDGRYVADVWAGSGVNRYEVTAIDDSGRYSKRLAWTLAGPFGDLDAPEADGAQVRLSHEIYDELAAIVSKATEPIWSTLEFRQKLLTVREGRDGVYKYVMTPTDFGVGSMDIAFTPDRDGVRFEVTFTDVFAFADVKTKLAFFGWKEREARAHVATLTVSALMEVHDLSVSYRDVGVNLAELDLDISDLPEFVEDLIVYFFEDDIVDGMTKSILEQCNNNMGGVFTGFSQSTRVKMPKPLSGELEAVVELTTLHADESGFKLGLSMTVDGETDPLRAHAPGPWRGNDFVPRLRGEWGYEAGLDLDLLNTLFFAAWQTGALDMSFEVDGDDVLRGQDLPDAETLVVFVDPQLPPIVRAGDRAGEIIIDLGAIRLDAVLPTTLGVVNAGVMAEGSARAMIFVRDGELAVTSTVEHLELDILVAPGDLEPEPTRRFVNALLERDVIPKFAALAASTPIPEADLRGLGLPRVSSLRVFDLDVVEADVPGALVLTGGLFVE